MRNRSNVINNEQQQKDFLSHNEHSQFISKPTRQTLCKQAIPIKC